MNYSTRLTPARFRAPIHTFESVTELSNRLIPSAVCENLGPSVTTSLFHELEVFDLGWSSVLLDEAAELSFRNPSPICVKNRGSTGKQPTIIPTASSARLYDGCQ